MKRLAVPVLAAVLLLTGCAEQGVQSSNGTSTNVDGVTEWKSPTGSPISFSGPTSDGSTYSSKAHRGEILVVNFWYAGCPPCNAEAADLQSVAAAYKDKKVQFVGINTTDGAAMAKSYERQYSISYPSILDQSNSGAAQLAFAGSISPNAIPSTMVLDAKGRVVARIVGELDKSTLSTLIDDALDGKAA